MTVQQLEENLDDRELTYWRVYLRARPVREVASWLQLALMMRLFINAHTEEGKPLPTLAELMPDLEL